MRAIHRCTHCEKLPVGSQTCITATAILYCRLLRAPSECLENGSLLYSHRQCKWRCHRRETTMTQEEILDLFRQRAAADTHVAQPTQGDLILALAQLLADSSGRLSKENFD